MLEILTDIAVGFLDTFADMAPYLLFGFLAAGLISVFISPKTVERHLGGRKIWSSVKAALFGVPLPLCSCSVIPVSASLKKHGAGNGATTSFLLSTPQTGVDSILVTLSLLGPVWAIYRPLAALLSGIFGGILVSMFVRETEYSTSDSVESSGRAEDTCSTGDAGCASEACSLDASKSSAGLSGKVRNVFFYGFVTLPADIGRALLVGLFIAALITAVAPDDFFAAHLGPGILAILIMMAAGIPIYVCATASVPIAAALIMKGVPAGAVWAFLVTGPATNAATLATIWKVMGIRTTLIYLGTVVLTAIGGGLLLDSVLIPAIGEQAHYASHGYLPEWLKYASGVILLGVILNAFIRARFPGGDEAATDTEDATLLSISGMTCEHCAENVKKALLTVKGVENVNVDLKTGIAHVRGNAPDITAMIEAVKEAGYDAKHNA